MKEYRLVKYYPSLPTEWIWHDKEFEFPIIVVEREDGYHLHPSLKGMTRFAIIPEREVDRNEEFWVEVSAEKQNNRNMIDIKPLKAEQLKIGDLISITRSGHKDDIEAVTQAMLIQIERGFQVFPITCSHENIKREDGCDECLDCGVRNY